MKTIMVVDDSPTVLLSMETLLKKASFETLMMRSGEDALTLLGQSAAPHVIFTDLNMTGMDGIDFIREARKIGALRFTPILMLTSESHVARRQEAQSAGATGWIVKPINGNDLLKVIAQLLPGLV